MEKNMVQRLTANQMTTRYDNYEICTINHIRLLIRMINLYAGN